MYQEYPPGLASWNTLKSNNKSLDNQLVIKFVWFIFSVYFRFLLSLKIILNKLFINNRLSDYIYLDYHEMFSIFLISVRWMPH